MAKSIGIRFSPSDIPIDHLLSFSFIKSALSLEEMKEMSKGNKFGR